MFLTQPYSSSSQPLPVEPCYLTDKATKRIFSLINSAEIASSANKRFKFHRNPNFCNLNSKMGCSSKEKPNVRTISLRNYTQADQIAYSLKH